MKRPLLAVALGLLVLTGCGTERASDSARTSPGPSASPTSQDTALAKHDRLFQDVAARCTDSTPSPSPTRSADGEPPNPEAEKYAENHAYKRTMPLKPDAQCRGQAHADRITKALSTGDVRDKQALSAALEKLSYPKNGTQIHAVGETLVFSLFIPETGPCLSGKVTSPDAEVTPHGPYMEGGCTEPTGGH
ncbi:hypothetical protein [Streptomyces apocyni]|uniref:hypothetical protein n=1 Tax=Streptomyces apocyni TaxID=2654677 RepID=UPI0012EAE49B|nr:hypothetical protein [Streptomyces apocyni]